MEQAGLAFSSREQDVIERHVDVKLNELIEDVILEYDVMATAEWINHHSFQRVCPYISLLFCVPVDVIKWMFHLPLHCTGLEKLTELHFYQCIE
jgi:hypothetical protein